MVSEEKEIKHHNEWVEKQKVATGVSAGSNILLYGGAYNFKSQPERLKYVGKHKGWHQFEKIGEAGIWCELLDSNLHMIEETKEN